MDTPELDALAEQLDHICGMAIDTDDGPIWVKVCTEHWD